MKKIRNKILAALGAGVLCMASIPALAAEANISVQVNGKKVAFSGEKPKVISGTTYVPLRGVFEELGYEVWWIPSSKLIILDKDGLGISLRQDSTYIMNGEHKALKNKILTLKGNTMLPLREVSTLVGAKVDWNSKTNTVVIVSNTLTDTKADSQQEEDSLKDDMKMDGAKEKELAMYSYVEVMKQRKKSIQDLNSKYGYKIYLSDIKKEDRQNYIKEYKEINTMNIEATKAIQESLADGDFDDVTSKTIALLNLNASLIEDYLIDDIPISFVNQMTEDTKLKQAIIDYCMRNGLDTKLFYDDIEERYGQEDVVRFF